MSVKFVEPHSSQLADEQELPTLLSFGRHRRPCKTSHGNRKLAPESKSTGGFHGAFTRQNSIESSKSFCVGDQKLEEFEMANSEVSVGSDPGHRAFPLKALPLKRWRAAAKIQGYLAKWRKTDAGSATKAEGTNVEIQERPPQSWVQYWPEEPDAPTPDDLEALSELECLLIEHHGTMAAAYKFIINCVKNPGNVECNMTNRELRIALHLKTSKEGLLPSSPGGDRLDQMFDKLLTLLRKRGGDISRMEFLRFPELLSREKALQETLLSSGIPSENLLLGSRLHQRLTGPIGSAEEAQDLFTKAVIALQLEPSRTANLLFQVGSASCASSIPNGLTSSVSSILCISRQFGAPNAGKKLDVLLAGWTLCNALAKQVIALGVPLPATPEPSKNQKHSKLGVSSKTKASGHGRSKSLASAFGRRYQCKVEVNPTQATQPPHDNQCRSHENECKAAFWQALSTEEILWNVGCGAEVLNDEDFKILLRTAWDLFDNFDAVGCLLGPVGWGRMRPKLDALAALNLQQHVVGSNQEDARSHMQNAVVLLQQIASMCEADPRLARIAALYGASFLADRVCSTANRYADFADEAVGSAAAQMNRSASSIREELMLHVEELLGGRKVDCCLSSGEFKIVPAATAAPNPLAEWHQTVTAAVLANGTAKGDAKRSGTQEFQRLKPVDKYLLGYGNLQGF